MPYAPETLPMADFDADRKPSGTAPSDRSGQRAVADDARVFAAIFNEHAALVWRAVRSLGVREADIEDVCQDVFLVVHKKLRTFEGRSTVRTWIYGIALRVVSDYRKKAHRKRERLFGDVPEQSTPASAEDATARNQAWRVLDQVLDGLSEDRRQVFVLYELEQLPMREVAGILECPLQTAYSRLEAAREIVQRGMAAWRERGQP